MLRRHGEGDWQTNGLSVQVKTCPKPHSRTLDSFDCGGDMASRDRREGMKGMKGGGDIGFWGLRVECGG